MIEFACQSCGQKYQVNDDLAGRRVKCKACQAVVAIPTPASSYAKPASTDPYGFEDPRQDGYGLRDPEPNANPYAAPTSAPDRYPNRFGDADDIGGKFLRPAGFWSRFVASIIDGFILGLAGFGVGFVLAIVGVAVKMDPGLIQLIAQLLGIVINLYYYASMYTGPEMATYGKRAMGIRVVTDDGRRISTGQAIGREFAKILSALPLMLGFLMVPFHPKKKALHDIIAGTRVVYR